MKIIGVRFHRNHFFISARPFRLNYKKIYIFSTNNNNLNSRNKSYVVDINEFDFVKEDGRFVKAGIFLS